MTPLFERFRPQAWADLIGQDKAVRKARFVGRDGYGGRAWFLVGGSGTGKTSMARIIAREVADPTNIIEVDASEVTAEFLREADRLSYQYSLGVKPGRAYIVNEAHRCRADVIGKFNSIFEPVPAHVVWIFTTTNEGTDKLFDDGIETPMFLSRCTRIDLARRDLCKAFAAHAKAIAMAEGLDGKPIEFYENVVKAERNNLRAVLNRIESGELVA